jgi:dienelactone hydrolase
MHAFSSTARTSVNGAGRRKSGIRGLLDEVTHPVRAAARAAVFFLKVFPMLPSAPVDWVTESPVVERVTYPTRTEEAQGDLYRPASAGPHPGIVVCLGVVPFEVDHPQVPVLGNALARAGFAALLYWSPAMRDLRLDPDDVDNIALAYDWLITRPDVDGARSGLLGTCVGGSFALMAASTPLIRDRIAILSTYAPFSSMWTFARDIASSTRTTENGTEPWPVDQLTRKVFVHSLAASLEPREAALLRDTFSAGAGTLNTAGFSMEGRAVYDLLTASDPAQADLMLHRLPRDMQEHLSSLSPQNYLQDLRVPVIVLLHDRGDQVIPVGESRRLVRAFGGRPGLHYTEMQFQHLDPVKGKLPLPRLLRELGKFLLAVYPIFGETTP